MTLEQALQQPFEVYMQWCWAFVANRAQVNPLVARLFTYPGAPEYFEAVWARRYWFARNGATC
ncbi:MAG TPA: hypothetical protein VFW94_23560 [Candidatus Acidoferrales bacterium]|nr:hypothetical protein [Candidatus Acidoferrales bacterium]